MLKIIAFWCLSAFILVNAQGLQHTIIKKGEGIGAQSGQKIQVHYVGMLTDSTIFDSSRERDEPLEFTLGAGQVIAGWEKGLLGMQVGEVRHLVIPPEMGYGAQAVGAIPANSTLQFEVEMLAIEKGLEPDTLARDWRQLLWQETVPGLKIFDEKPGQGAEAAVGSAVQVHFSGWLTGGTKFSSSKTTNRPVESVLGLNKFILGWEQGLVGVKPGAVRWLWLKPNLGYGNHALAQVPPNSELLYRIEVLKVERDDESLAQMDLFPSVAEVPWQEGREGLQYAVVQTGAGAPAQAGQTVQVHYTGWLENGQKFDSSRDRDQMFKFPLGAGRVIRGWDLGVEGMMPGEKRLLRIPAGLGYGSRGAGSIPPDATLIFVVEYFGSEG